VSQRSKARIDWSVVVIFLAHLFVGPKGHFCGRHAVRPEMLNASSVRFGGFQSIEATNKHK
jgi:hypothetical protein